MNALRAMSALLTYPTEALQAAVPELGNLLDAERLLSKESRGSLESLLNRLRYGELLDLEENYVFLFDRTQSHSLYLFQHVHGDSRDRGQAMVDLRNQYQQAGLSINSNELPDYIPMFLEYLSLLERKEAQVQLGMCSHILAALAERLSRQQSAYASVFAALVELADARPTDSDLADLLSQEIDDPDNLQVIDEIWEERAVSFRPDAQDCERNMNPTVQKVEFKSCANGAD